MQNEKDICEVTAEIVPKMTGWPQWLTTYDHLGSHYPLFHEFDQGRFHLDVESAIEAIPLDRRIVDPIGVLEILSASYLFSDRTLIKGLKRAPWMSKPKNDGSWQRASIPKHGTTYLPVDDIATKLKSALRNEALEYISGSACVGVLLSGGLDSRIVAGILRELQLTSEFNGDVVAITWGLKRSRDCLYAQQIAGRFGWEWVHFPVSPTTLEDNIFLAGKLGAEFSPLHLHAMHQVRNLEGINVILAGSYGDGVGRAEFSGRHVLKLRPTVPVGLNPFGLLLGEVVQQNRAQVFEDAYEYRKHLDKHKEHQYREIEQEMHYMRRKMGACMSYISERTPVFQLFTAPEVFGVMWQLSPTIRDHRFYLALLNTLPGNIQDIPWARSGRLLGSDTGPADKGSPQNHQYGLWLRHELRDVVVKLAQNEKVLNFGILNERNLERILRIWQNASTVSTNRLDEAISWLASFAVFVEHYCIRADCSSFSGRQYTVSEIAGPLRAFLYRTTRDKFRS